MGGSNGPGGASGASGGGDSGAPYHSAAQSYSVLSHIMKSLPILLLLIFLPLLSLQMLLPLLLLPLFLLYLLLPLSESPTPVIVPQRTRPVPLDHRPKPGMHGSTNRA